MTPSCLYSILLVLMLVICTALSEQDFYELLGLEKDADNREIRKAFKKLALKLHPDKNTEDPDAHSKFLKINRAYEVLKDEELRKKYDQYGEKGLSEDFRDRKYESWKFYQQNFGIYDDDEDVITLSRADFEQSVENTEDIWFINYYSAHCSHCHELAPTWREVSTELAGVVRIGAVNCADDWMLCQQQGIRSYPSLVIYPKRQKFQGTRSTKNLVKFALQEVKVSSTKLTSLNFESLTSSSKLPWLITYCTNQGGDCLDNTACLKLAAILESLVMIGSVDCTEQSELCSKMGIDSSITMYHSLLPIGHSNGLKIESLELKEITNTVLHQLPEITELNANQFLELWSNLKKDQGMPWLIHFVKGEMSQIELKKLPALLDGEINVGKIDCSQKHPACQELHIHKFPTFAVFKQGGRYEIHHGRITAHDVAAFARECGWSSVEALGPDDFPDRVQFSRELWFVDFFAPWCPPCMRLLPEFRKASKMIDVGPDVYFGTVDCTIHQSLCDKLNIRSYPTTILYNNTVPHPFKGNHDASSIIEFIKDVLDPPVIVLTDTDFELNLKGKSSKELWLVDYYTPWCPPCMQMLPEWRRFAKMLKGKSNVHVASIDCQTYSQACANQGINSYPTLRLYPIGQIGTSVKYEYQGWFRNAQNFMAWVQDFLPSKVKVLSGGTFEKVVLQSEKPWIVDFYASWCGPCQQFAPKFESLAEMMSDKVNFGKMECERNKRFCQNAYIQQYPTLRYYRGATRSQPTQNIFGEEIMYDGSKETVMRELVKHLAKKEVHDEL